jgi:ABC-type branched-subunit amino acid transport system substrate-binding protein
MKLTSSVIALASIIIVHVNALEEVSWGKTSPILILPAIFSITNASAPGGINLAGFQMAEAFKCAVQQLNASQLIPGLQIKAQVADSGSGTDSATRIAAFATRYLLSDKFYTFVFGGGNNYADAATANQLLKARGVSLMQYFPSGSNIVETTGIQSE